MEGVGNFDLNMFIISQPSVVYIHPRDVLAISRSLHWYRLPDYVSGLKIDIISIESTAPIVLSGSFVTNE